jgi:hypothetical protein
MSETDELVDNMEVGLLDDMAKQTKPLARPKTKRATETEAVEAEESKRIQRWAIQIRKPAHSRLIKLGKKTGLSIGVMVDFLLEELDLDAAAERMEQAKVKNVRRGRQPKRYHRVWN